jgi:hypothetical protein
LDNQQGRSIASLDFIAGLIVGEGSYGINVHRPKKGKWEFKPCFSLRMNDVDTIDLLQFSLVEHGLSIYRSPGVYKRCHTVRVDGLLRVKRHLDVFYPLLTGTKKIAAGIVYEFTNYRLGLPQKSKYTEKDISFIERLREVNGPSARRVPIETLRDYTLRPDLRGQNMRRPR